MSVSVAMPRYFGLTPPTLLFGIATASLAFAFVFAVLAHWILAIVLAVLAIALLTMFVGVARRKPDTRLARTSTRKLDRARERAVWAVESLAVRSATDQRTRGLRHELLLLAEERDRKLRELGDAVYRDDDDAIAAVRDELDRLDETATAKEAEMEEIAESARRRLEEGRLSVQATMIEPGGAVSVPEPAPPPDEGTPPAPAPIPEPGPPPDEGTPPRPDPVPDPGSPPRQD